MDRQGMGMLSCDTAVVLGNISVDGTVIFAKNSDRDVNECQPLCHAPRRRYGPGATLRCQYLEIPQSLVTWEVIGSRPWWLWGFEMGVNEWGVAIGNEAVFTREPFDEPALIGMDLVRLGLERGRTADEALAVIGMLVSRYGQGGACNLRDGGSYHNSFIIADPRTAWVLETAGRHWAAKRVRDRAAISNLLTLGSDWDRLSGGADSHGPPGAGRLDFAASFHDPAFDLAPSVCRLDRARALLGGTGVSVNDMVGLLRDHNDGGLPDGPRPLPTICMHARPGRRGETAAAMVAHLRPGRPRELAATCWTAFGSPCLSIMRPVYPFAVGLPEELDRGAGAYDSSSPWWVFERLQRLVARAPVLAPEVRRAIDAVEARFVAEAAEVETDAAARLGRGDRSGALRELRAFVDRTTNQALRTALSLTAEIAPRAATLAVPAMVDALAEPDAEANVPLPASPAAV